MCTEFNRKPSITHRKKIASLRTGTNNNSVSPPISNAKPIPNYLKPPAFSCHDACKYGHGHGFEPRRDIQVCPRQRGNGNGGIRGVVLNPELRVSGKKKKLKKKDDVKEDVFVDKEATFVENAVSNNVPGSTIELDIPEEKVFELSGASSVREISVSNQLEPSVNSSRDVSVPVPEDSSEDSTEEVVVSLSKDKSAEIVGEKKNAKATARINGSEYSGNGKKGEIERKSIKVPCLASPCGGAYLLYPRHARSA